ncbi:MAG TPA: hypothetical protein VKW78_04795 [Terriglobales bacterium]|nr:hypothetical protein [Terriglobales bacterium]
MRVTDLRQETLKLAQLSASDAPVVSCYLDLRCGSAAALWDQAAMVRDRLRGSELRSFVEAMSRIDDFLSAGLKPDSRGAAVFVRGGNRPHFLALQFLVPLATSLQLEPEPCIFGLLELLDEYENYIVLHACTDIARIVEIHLGVAVNETVWHRQFGSPASSETQRFLVEQVRLLDQVLSAGQYRHLILSGEPAATGQLMHILSNALAAKVIAVVNGSADYDANCIARTTLPAFMQYEEMESLARARALKRATLGKGLAVKGQFATLLALKSDDAKMIIVEANAFAPRSPMDQGDGLRQEVLRLAVRNACAIEIVRKANALSGCGGIGAFLRDVRQPASQIAAA